MKKKTLTSNNTKSNDNQKLSIPSLVKKLSTRAQWRHHALAQKQHEHKLKGINQQRRRFLDMLGKTGVSMPLLKSSSFAAGALMSRFALAQGNFGVKNVVFVYVSQGAPNGEWLPDNPGSLKRVSGVYGNNANLMAFRHVDTQVPGHASSRQALGHPEPSWSRHVDTVDMNIANVLGDLAPYPLMYLGANALMGSEIEGKPRLFSISEAELVNGPQAAINRFFNATPPNREDQGSKQLIAANERALQAFKNKLAGEEANRIQSHIDAVGALSDLIVPKEDGDTFDINACNRNINQSLNGTLEEGYRMADVATSALACGLTRVITLQVGDNKSYYSMPGYFGGEVHGQASHGQYHDHLNCCEGHQTVPAYMLQRLVETTGVDGRPLIDNTVFVSCNCMGDGASHNSHSSPWAMATRLPGFNTGFSAGDGGRGRDFISAIPIGLGLPAAEYVPLSMGCDDCDKSDLDPARSNILA